MLELQRVAQGRGSARSGAPRNQRSSSARSRPPRKSSAADQRSGSSEDERQTVPKQLAEPWLDGQRGGASQQQQAAVSLSSRLIGYSV